MQVIVQGKSDGAAMFLINETGIILSIKAYHTHDHVIGLDQSNSAPQHASPRGNKRVTQLSAELDKVNYKIEQLESQLNASRLEVESLKAALVKQKLKVKHLWKENCDLSLAHEDTIDLKDEEIAKLQGQLRQLETTTAGDHAHL